MKKRSEIILLIIVSTMIIACSSVQLFSPTATPTPAPTLTPSPTLTLTPTLTFTPTLTPTITPTPFPIVVGSWYAPIGVDMEIFSNTVHFSFTVSENKNQIEEWTIIDSLYGMAIFGKSVDIIDGKFRIEDSSMKYTTYIIEGTFALDRKPEVNLVKGTYEFIYGSHIGTKTGNWYGTPGEPPFKLKPIGD